ncbi:MAG: RNase adapter RapZ [Gammaproteobacteria bacterium]|nr:RNase adapter RapZ [Gammaproteobacteria bacterium]
MKLVIVSGLSGSGKSTALNVLEDLGYYCIDNLPLALLFSFATHMEDTAQKFYERVAVGIDARNRSEDLQHFPAILQGLRTGKIQTEVIFLDAAEDILIKRFSETRRKHPLTRERVSLSEAIHQERELLEPISSRADLYIDTSTSNLHQLRDLITLRVVGKVGGGMSLLFESFGYKHGLPQDADFVFDLRCLPNPHWNAQLRQHTGKERPVIEFLEQHTEVHAMFDDVCAFLEQWLPRIAASNRSYLTVAIGCTGGYHRSVYMVERLAAHFGATYRNMLVRHRELT